MKNKGTPCQPIAVGGPCFDTKCTIRTRTPELPHLVMEQIFIKPLLYARNYDKPQECKNEVDRLGPCPRGFIGFLVLVDEPAGWQARRLRLGAGEPCLDRNVIFLGFSPHSIALLQGLTLHLSLWKVKNQLFIPFCVELYCRNFMNDTSKVLEQERMIWKMYWWSF